MKNLILIIIAGLILSGCTSKTEMEEIEKQVDILQERVNELIKADKCLEWGENECLKWNWQKYN